MITTSKNIIFAGTLVLAGLLPSAFADAPFILNQSSGLVNNSTTKLLVSKDGSLYIGTSFGLSRYLDGKITNNWTSTGNGSYLQIITALGQSDTEIFIGKARQHGSYGTQGFGVERIKWQGDMFFWEEPLSCCTRSYVSAILIDEQQPTPRPEIIANNTSSNPGAHIAADLTFKANIDLLSGESLWAVLDFKTQILFGGDNGLFVFQGNTQVGNFDGSQWKENSGPFQAFANRSVRAMVRDNDGNVWIGLQAGKYEDGGLVKYAVSPDNLLQGTFSQAALMPGGNDVRALAVDGNNNVWIATDNGLKRRNADGTFQYFGLADGLPSYDIRDVAYDSKTKYLWIATSNGVARFTLP